MQRLGSENHTVTLHLFCGHWHSSVILCQSEEQTARSSIPAVGNFNDSFIRIDSSAEEGSKVQKPTDSAKRDRSAFSLPELVS